MSKVSISGNASGTGTFTIQSPATNTDRALTLPDEAGTVLTSASDIESQVKTATNATGSAPIYACRAWVNFNGTGTVAIRESGNVSSITDNGTGDYTVNFTTAMPDANYAVTVSNNGGSGAFTTTGTFLYGSNPVTTTTVRINTQYTTTQATADVFHCHLAIYR
jgi:hypothetical protein